MKIQSDDKHTINLLWTGGWDSTYRLIDLIHVKKVTVQPYYIIDYERTSTFIELQTMQKLKEMIEKFDKKSHDRILPLIVIPRFAIDVPKIIADKIQKLKQIHHLGGQYEWIASFASHFGLDDLEMSVEYDEDPAGVQAFLYGKVTKVKDKRIGNYYILDEASENTALSLFKCFRFPILDISKVNMQEKADQLGFDHILKQTWFCHSPIGTTPCGVCKPCQAVVRENMKYRLPRGALRRYHWRKYILWLNSKFDDSNLYLRFKRLIRNSFQGLNFRKKF